MLPGRAQGKAEGLSGDWGNIILLLVLYTLQGVPMGLCLSIPLILQERGVSYADQAVFKLTSWPFSLKIFWAPIVDAIYVRRFGRRKTWIIPAQLLLGAMLLWTAEQIPALLGDSGGGAPDVWTLTVIFFGMYFVCATQDIAVDGWCLTLLSRRNVGYASTCNAVGQTFGFFLSYTGLLSLQQMQWTDLQGYMRFWGWAFFAVTTYVAVVKRERVDEEEPESAMEVLRQASRIVRLAPVRRLFVLLFTWKIAFAAADNVAQLKFVQYGLPKSHLAIMGAALTPVEVILPIVVGKWTAGDRPFDVAAYCYLPRVGVGVVAALCLAAMSAGPVRDAIDNGEVPWGFYGVVCAVLVVHGAASSGMFVSQMALFARVSDPAIGGTYMTLLNTVSNLGGMWPGIVSVALVDLVTLKEGAARCVGHASQEACAAARSGGCRWFRDMDKLFRWAKAAGVPGPASEVCDAVAWDGFYVLTAACTVIGVVWFTAGGRAEMRRLQDLPRAAWYPRHRDGHGD